MYTIVRSFYALPGKRPELIAAVKTAAALASAPAMVSIAIGGNINEVNLAWQAEDLGNTFGEVSKVMASPQWPAIAAKFAECTVPNTSQERIYLHV